MTSVIIVVFDGLQPAQVTPNLMPNLSRLAAEGVTCSNHHAIFPTVTRANVASIVTGHYPGAHGLTANTLVIPEFDQHREIGALEPVLTEMATRTPVLLKPTLGDILHQHGKEFIAVGAGTTGNAYLQNPNANTGGGATIHPDFTLPRPLHQEITERFGSWPDRRGPAAPKMARIVDILTGYVLNDRQPAASVLWFSEPDSSQHAHGVGSAEAVSAIHEADRQFGRLLDWLDRTGRTADTNVIVASDHGYSTISEVIDVDSALRDAGFPPADQRGGVAFAPNGGSALFYATSEVPDTSARLAEWLMTQRWCGPLLASEAAGVIPGTLPAHLIGLEGPRAPSITMSFDWDSTANSAGFAGRAYSTSLAPGQGQHGSMSPHETRNIFFASGPAFRRSTYVDSPTGNVDIAPTVLHLLGLPEDPEMHGRILFETLLTGPDNVEWVTEIHRAERDIAAGRYSQSVTLSRAGNTVYVVQGSGGLLFS